MIKDALTPGVRHGLQHQAKHVAHWKRRTLTLAVISTLSLMGSGLALAATEPSLSQLKAENQRLRQEIEALKQTLNSQAAPPVAEPAPSQAASVEQAPVADEPAGASSGGKKRAPKPAKGATGGGGPVSVPSAEGVETLDQVVVRARTREEKLRDVPIPVSVVGSKSIERNNASTIADFSRLAPNLVVHVPNARQQSIQIRGVGKNVSNDALEPSVGVIIDGVASAYIAQAWGDFGDLDHVEVLRGPQGTLLGKNTTLGVVNVVTKAPSFTPEFNAEVLAGNYDQISSKGSFGGAIQDGVLAYRASFFSEKRNGPFINLAPDQTNETFNERNRFGGKVSFLLLPTSNLSVRLNLDRQESAELLAWGQPPLIGEPANFLNGVSRTLVTAGNGSVINALTYSSRLARPYFAGYKPIIGNWDAVDNRGSRPTKSNTDGVSAQIDWDAQVGTLTSITAYRTAMFDAKNDSNWTRFDTARGGAISNQEQLSEELRWNSAIGTIIDYTAGVYLLSSKIDSTDRSLYGTDAGAFYATAAQYNALSRTAVGKQLLQDSLRNLFVYTETQPNTTSAAGYGQLNWHFTEKGTLTVGVRGTHENRPNTFTKWSDPSIYATNGNAYYRALGATAAELAAASAIYNAQLSGNRGPAYASWDIPGIEVSETSWGWLFNPSYKLTPDLMLYASVGRGVKSGASQLDTSGTNGAKGPVPYTVAPETALDFEIGAKTTFFDQRLVLNANIYQTNVTDYQQTLTVVDPVTTATTGVTSFRSYLGNVPGVTLRGIEIDGSYAPGEMLVLNFGAAYNDAFYSDFTSAPCPSEISGELDPYTGKTIAANQICDFTGKTLPYAPKFSGNIGGDWRLPLNGNFNLHVFGNVVYRGSANWAADLSPIGEQGGYFLFDGGIGVQTTNGKWELALVGRNLDETEYVTNINSYSTSAAATATPGDRGYLGVVLRGRY